MKTPKFIELIQKSTLLYFIVSNGFLPENLLEYEYITFWSSTSFDIENITIGNEHFRWIYVVDDEDFVYLAFTTDNLDYFDNPELYFGRKGITRINRDYQINDEVIRQQNIELGVFHIPELKYPVHIELKNRNDHCVVVLKILSREWKEKDFAKPKHYFDGILTSSAVLRLLNPEKFILKNSFLPDSYSRRVDIHIEENGHPVQKYFEHKAMISFQGGIYEFGVIPNLMVGESCDLIFEEYNSIYNSPILHLENCKKEEVVSTDSTTSFVLTTVTYRSESPEIQFFKIDNKIYTKNELASKEIDLEHDYELTDFLFGKAAIEELGKFEYYQGVQVYIKK